MKSNPSENFSRRRFLLSSTIAAAGIITTRVLQNKSFAQAPGIITSDKMRPKIPYGVASGDINANSAVIWSRSDKPARMIVDYATNESFNNAKRVIGPAALEVSDFTARVNLNNLPKGEQVFYRVIFQDLADINTSKSTRMVAASIHSAVEIRSHANLYVLRTRFANAVNSNYQCINTFS